ncbi:MAG TPA: hypothetical protein EYO35_14465 [Flavobacteriaceae bacterium]|nr:hypothetical protein [Flavobacteriaceae bacterium]
MIFLGNLNELNDEADELAENLDIQYSNGTKSILGYECKKAVMTGAEGASSTYCCTEKISRPEALQQMPDMLPGIYLGMEIASQSGVK